MKPSDNPLAMPLRAACSGPLPRRAAGTPRVTGVFLALFLAFATGLFGALQAAESDPGVLQRQPLEKYSAIWERSPFVAVTDLSGQVDDMTGRFVITGYARTGDQEMAFLFDRTSLERFSLRPGQERNGVNLESITHEGNLKTLSAKLNTGGKSLVLKYDPAAVPMSQPQPVAVPSQNPGQDRRGRGQPSAQPTTNTQNQNQVVGQAPAAGEIPPPPRRVIRRRGIVAPE